MPPLSNFRTAVAAEMVVAAAFSRDFPSFEAQLSAIIQFAVDLLQAWSPCICKIGITHHPEGRSFGYYMEGYGRMQVLYTSRRVAAVADMEDALIQYFHNYCNARTEYSCANIRQGRDSLYKLRRWAPPYHTYICLASADDTHLLRKARRQFEWVKVVTTDEFRQSRK